MLRSAISTWREYLTPISHKSNFLSTGQITPEEFIQAGDYLVHMFPTWKWNGVENLDNVNYRDFLPSEKQFLVSRKVPCTLRANDFFNLDDDFGVTFDEDDFLSPKNDDKNKNNNNNNYNNDQEIQVSHLKVANEENPIEVDDIDDLIESMDINEVAENNEDVAPNEILIQEEDEDEIVITNDPKIRYYDLYIAYSTSYRVPKMYIVGFNVEGKPLTSKEMFEDITTEYRDKTVTIEKLPFFKTTVTSVSIHPCKHANVMKILLEKVRLVKKRRREQIKKQEQTLFKSNDNDVDDWEDLHDDMVDTLHVDQYLVVFLKFITSITPSIEHDYTMEGW